MHPTNWQINAFQESCILMFFLRPLYLDSIENQVLTIFFLRPMYLDSIENQVLTTTQAHLFRSTLGPAFL